jgi:hypothetical protein
MWEMRPVGRRSCDRSFGGGSLPRAGWSEVAMVWGMVGKQGEKMKKGTI